MGAAETQIVRWMIEDFGLKVRIRVVGTDPDEVSRRTGLKPTTSWKRGEAHPSGRYMQTHTRWELLSPGAVDLPVAEQVDALLQKIEEAGTSSVELAALGAFVSFSGYVNDCSVGFDLPPSLIERIADLGLGVDFDVYLDGSASAAPSRDTT